MWAERQRIREHFLSDMLMVLFLLHAPLSQRAFYFFACSPVMVKFSIAPEKKTSGGVEDCKSFSRERPGGFSRTVVMVGLGDW